VSRLSSRTAPMIDSALNRLVSRMSHSRTVPGTANTEGMERTATGKHWGGPFDDSDCLGAESGDPAATLT